MSSTPSPISSVTNPRVKDLVRLRQRKHRDRSGLMIVEEPLVIKRGLDAGLACRELYFCPDNLTEEEGPLLRRILAKRRISAFTLTPPVMEKIAYRDHPQGLLVTADQPAQTLNELALPATEQALILVLEAVEKPGNLGAAQRVADGAGAHAILVCGGGTDPWNPNVLRASRGACFAVPTLQTSTEEALTWLQTHKVTSIAAAPRAETPYSQVDLTGPVAIFLGTEHDGLSETMLDAADISVAIPMLGCGDSLNVSTSASILLYEVQRQRSLPRKAI